MPRTERDLQRLINIKMMPLIMWQLMRKLRGPLGEQRAGRDFAGAQAHPPTAAWPPAGAGA